MIRRRFLVLAGVTALAFAMANSTAQAGLTAYSTENGGGAGVTISLTTASPLGNPLSTTASSFTTHFSTDGGITYTSKTTYCVDLYHYTSGPVDAQVINANTFAANTSTNYTTSQNTQTDAYSQAGLGRAAWLVSTYANSTGVNQAALQIAVWKAEYETHHAGFSASYASLTSGDAQFATDALTQNQAQLYLLGSLLAGGGQYATMNGYWVSMHKDGNITQDQLYGSPEPSALAIAALGAMGLVGYGLRRKRV
jgi:hypothetical protein